MLLLVVYDTNDDRLRRRLAALLEGYGHRVQWSVFECRLRPAEQRALSRRLRDEVSSRATADDVTVSVRLYPVDAVQRERVIELGDGPAVVQDEAVLFA